MLLYVLWLFYVHTKTLTHCLSFTRYAWLSVRFWISRPLTADVILHSIKCTERSLALCVFRKGIRPSARCCVAVVDSEWRRCFTFRSFEMQKMEVLLYETTTVCYAMLKNGKNVCTIGQQIELLRIFDGFYDVFAYAKAQKSSNMGDFRICITNLCRLANFIASLTLQRPIWISATFLFV